MLRLPAASNVNMARSLVLQSLDLTLVVNAILRLNVSGEDFEIKVVFDGDHKWLRALLHELGERKRLKRATPMPTRGLQTPPTPWHGSHPSSLGLSLLRMQPNTSTVPHLLHQVI
jgi:hypothetical protein